MKSRLADILPECQGIKRKIITDSIVAQAGNFTRFSPTYVPLGNIKLSSGVLSSVSYAQESRILLRCLLRRSSEPLRG